MNIILNYRHKNERLEESLQAIGCSIVYNVWDIDQINEIGAYAVIFEFKQILKEEFRFLRLSYKLKRAAIPIVTWCLDLPNIGARQWKLSLLLKTKLIDIFSYNFSFAVSLAEIAPRLRECRLPCKLVP